MQQVRLHYKTKGITVHTELPHGQVEVTLNQNLLTSLNGEL